MHHHMHSSKAGDESAETAKLNEQQLQGH
jgi:hypothetical protein